MGAAKLLAAVSLIAVTAFFILPTSIQLVSAIVGSMLDQQHRTRPCDSADGRVRSTDCMVRYELVLASSFFIPVLLLCCKYRVSIGINNATRTILISYCCTVLCRSTSMT